MVIKLKNKLWIILVVLIIVGVGLGVYFFATKNNKTQNDYTSSKTSTNQQNYSENNSSNNNSTSNNKNEIDINISSSPSSEVQPSTATIPKTEEAISSFSTKIYTKDSARQNNISITCSSINETVIPNGSTFSFCNTVGPATSTKGYQEADIFDKDGNKKKGLGGGNCQVSTTLYNAVLAVPSLVVTERHEHSNKVPYIQNGKDAAVAYGSYDLKFKNNSGHDIKIKANATSNNVTISLYKII